MQTVDYVNTINQLEATDKITKYQAKGMLLEIAVYEALISMGIYPIPLHNPYDENYAKDQHLNVDMIFRYEGKTYAVECKNLNHNCEWSKEWVNSEVIKRFEYLEKTVPVDYRLIVTTYTARNIPIGYMVLVTHREANKDNLPDMKVLLVTVIMSLFNQIENDNNVYSIHGYINKTAKGEYIKLKRIDERLKDVVGWIEHEA